MGIRPLSRGSEVNDGILPIHFKAIVHNNIVYMSVSIQKFCESLWINTIDA